MQYVERLSIAIAVLSVAVFALAGCAPIQAPTPKIGVAPTAEQRQEFFHRVFDSTRPVVR